MTDQPTPTQQSETPRRTWVTRAETLVALALAAVFVAWVGVIVWRQRCTGCEIEIIQGKDAADYRIDVSVAPVQELTVLPQIGEVRAGRIVKWRKENGPFASFDQFRQAAGLSERMMEDVAPYITLGTSAPASAED